MLALRPPTLAADRSGAPMAASSGRVRARGGEDLGALRILILAATQSGNALLVADVLSERLTAAGALRIDIAPEGSVPDPDLKAVDLLIACVATHGDGELPDSFMPAFEAFRAGQADLGHVRYGLVALGDRTYKTFCGGGHRFAGLLDARGARRLGEVCEIDAASQPFPDEDAVAWLQRWLAEL